MKENDILDVQYKQRALDGKWMKMIKIFDDENVYRYVTPTKQTITLLATKWIIANVYDYEIVMED